MTFYVENETSVQFPFVVEDVVRLVCEAVLDEEGCPFETQINVILTDNEGIHEMNKRTREIDKETDVLSFPNVDFEIPGIFDIDESREADYFDPESGELFLGDIMISADKVIEQANEYGHSQKREFAFLIAHSMLHLCGCDHLEPNEAEIMETKQDQILAKLGITRDI